MRIRVQVKPGAHTDEVARLADGSLSVRVKARAKDGEANDAVVRIVARFYKVPKSSVRLVSGRASRTKLLDVPGQSPGLPCSIIDG